MPPPKSSSRLLKTLHEGLSSRQPQLYSYVSTAAVDLTIHGVQSGRPMRGLKGLVQGCEQA